MNYQKHRIVTYRKHDKQGPTPAIIIEGRFLEQFNFKLGDRYEVAYSQGVITIKAMNPILLNEHQRTNLSLLTGDVLDKLQRGDWRHTPAPIMHCVTCGKYRITTPIMHFFKFDGRRFQCYSCQRKGLKANV